MLPTHYMEQMTNASFFNQNKPIDLEDVLGWDLLELG